MAERGIIPFKIYCKRTEWCVFRSYLRKGDSRVNDHGSSYHQHAYPRRGLQDPFRDVQRAGGELPSAALHPQEDHQR